MKEETVLCIQRDLLPTSWVQQISIVPMNLSQFCRTCSDADFDFIPRSKAESDPSTKQIIPYVILQTQDFSQTAVYSRQGSEKRLHDLWSIGLGGHINPQDQDGEDPSFESALMKGMERELDEELSKRPLHEPVSFLGIISEEETEVGSVHLGAVFRILTRQPELYLPGTELFDFSWTATRDLSELNLELWSRMSLKLIENY